MQVHVSADSRTKGVTDLTRQIGSGLEITLLRFEEAITWVEVPITDENGRLKSGDHDMRCPMEARLAGRQPIKVSDEDSSLAQASAGATDRL